jgi:signal transduction histidine kinase
MGLSLFITSITNLTNVGLLGFVLLRRSGISHKTAVYVFAGSIVSLVLWSTGNYFADTSTVLKSALFWTRATFPLALFMCWFIFYFSCVFPVHKEKKQRIVWIYLVGVVLLSVISFGESIIVRVGLDPRIGISEVVVGELYLGAVAMYLILIGHATYNFIQNYKRLTGRYRSQVGYVLLGWSSFLFFAVFTNAILPFITGNAHWSKFGPLGSVMMMSFITYAIVRHEFLDIKVVIQRGLIYSVLFGCILFVYLALLFVGEVVFSVTTEVDAIVSAFVTTVIGIFGVPPLEKYFQRVTARVFFKDRYEYSVVLKELATVLNENIVRDSIVKKTTVILEQTFKVTDVIFCDTPTKSAEEMNRYPITVPIRSNRKKIGMLCLGEKRSGDAYTEEDMSLLNTFCSQAGVALEKAELYAQVQSYATSLEARVEERTIEVQTLQKEQESMMLELSHGLQTPLTIMKGELFFLRKLGYEVEKIDTIDSSINRISMFIRKLLDLYRLQDSLRDSFQKISLRELLCTVVASFHNDEERGVLKIEVDASQEVAIVGDYHGLEEVFSNLISNSIKYSEKGRENCIKIILTDLPNEVRIVFSDTGIGIKEQDLQNLFKKFYRVRDERTRGVEGTGLGLVICKKILSAHGGDIQVESNYGAGTTFTVTLPKT